VIRTFSSQFHGVKRDYLRDHALLKKESDILLRGRIEAAVLRQPH
jgi:hypothetical protein